MKTIINLTAWIYASPSNICFMISFRTETAGLKSLFPRSPQRSWSMNGKTMKMSCRPLLSFLDSARALARASNEDHGHFRLNGQLLTWVHYHVQNRHDIRVIQALENLDLSNRCR